MKKVIIGGPKTGKSTLADQSGMPVRRTDTLKDLPWGKDSEEVARWISQPGDAVIEGVAAGRGLRKWLAQNPEGRLDGVEVVNLTRPHGYLSEGQQRMGKGCDTVFQEIRPELLRRGAKVR